ncbi:MAG: hypothetical protein LC808_09485 [Actinobacteria bacterium]|nr:hypothetical protein [Actinomycetota bacterium]
MKHLVLVYNRRTGELIVDEEYDDGNTALDRRFELEPMYPEDEVEVVVLSAPSREQVMKTHRRYFSTLGELANG